jgi:hypothetical protein
MAKTRKPKTFYKYKPVDKYLFELLNTNTFYYSNINELNDFYDLRFQLENEFIKNSMLNTYLENKSTSDNLKNKSLNEILSHINTLMLDPNFRHNYQEKLYQKLDTKICCFTRNRFSSSMWTFYADYYKGVVLEFDFSNDLSLHHLIRKVYYLRNVHLVKSMDDIRRSCIVKMPEWSREKEWRIIVYGDGNKAIFNKDCLKSITFGFNVKPNHISKITTIVRKKYNSVKLYKLAWTQTEMKRLPLEKK